MAVDLNLVVRKMLLLGVPLLGASAAGGCTEAFSSCPEDRPASPPQMRDLMIANPRRADAGMASAELLEAFRTCVEQGQCLAFCRTHDSTVQSCTLVGDDAGVGEKDRITVHAVLPPALCEGRRPGCDRGLAVPAPRRAPTALGAWLARAAYLEARSVPAFERLAAELTAHGAPGALIAGAQRAVGEERRHARVMTTLARRFGARPPRARTSPSLPVRPLLEVASENAAEGCVRETLGALVARRQAAFAQDRAVRAAMGVIARDEAGHAELAWQVDAWARTRLGTAANAVDEALASEARALRAELARPGEPAPELVSAAGMPAAAVLRQIAAAAQVLLWSPAASELPKSTLEFS